MFIDINRLALIQLLKIKLVEPTPLFSLLSPERSSLAVFAGVQGVVHPVFHISIK